MKLKNRKRLAFRLLFAAIAPQLFAVLLYVPFASVCEKEMIHDDVLLVAVTAASITFRAMMFKALVYSAFFEFLVTRFLVSPTTARKHLAYAGISAAYWAAAGWVPLCHWSIVPGAAVGAICAVCLAYAQDRPRRESAGEDDLAVHYPPLKAALLVPLLLILCWAYLFVQDAMYTEPPVDYTYFPECLFHSQEFVDNRIVERHLFYLNALDEPSIYKLRNQEDKSVFRLLWTGGLCLNAISRRLDILPDGTGRLITKNGWVRHGCRPGKTRTWKARLDKDRVAEFLSLIESENFWELRPGNTKLMMDGYTVLIEGLREGRYHAVERCCPDEDEGPVSRIEDFFYRR